ncbi:aberrant root formation protein 4 [Pyrus ussuriensis x Pyrus communis]|uniref:Aberrant root formation protein 4 n=1 Tax=Pyrus ussuriensis x Pyrus communis TaxID=2448454 RepID=A0A5N5GTS0_9ROSA|nr:aberrant root formation protein 4 [Pyrus ussuriensis x Pyrus communis]
MADNLDQCSPLLQEILNSLSQSVDEPQTSVSELISFLNSTLDAALSDPENEDAKANAFRALTKVHQFVSTPSLDQAIIEALSFELPMAVSKFGGVSDGCLELVECTIDCFISMCSPRDMLSILCEALAPPSETIRDSGYIAPLLTGLSKVFLSLQRRHFEQVKVAVPIIVKVLKGRSLELEDEDPEFKNLFDRAMGIANSIRAVCLKLEGVESEKLRALLGLYVVQIMAVVSMNHNVASSQPFVLQLSSFFPFCGLSYLGVITGSDVDKITRAVVGEDEDDYMSCLSDVKCGASLSVIWGHASDDVAGAAEEDLNSVKDELKDNQTERWQAVGMLKHILAPATLPWELKRHAINFLICITDGNISHCDEHNDFSSYMTTLFAALQAVQMIIMYASDTVLRKNAFEAFKRILADIPASQRFDMLKSLIINSNSSSMIAILLDIVKGELHKESCQNVGNDELPQAKPPTLFWTANVLELVELILKPPEGGPPSFPEDTDKVLSALNLYRFVLIKESTGKTNHTGVISRSNLQKAYKGWLLPLRTQVTALMAETRNDYELPLDALCTLNPIELVLYRCIELVEDQLKQQSM